MSRVVVEDITVSCCYSSLDAHLHANSSSHLQNDHQGVNRPLQTLHDIYNRIYRIIPIR